MDVSDLEKKLKKLDIKTTGRELADVLGMNEQSYSRKRKQGSEIKYGDILKIEQKFNISLTSHKEDEKIVFLTGIRASCGGGCQVSDNLIPNYDKSSLYSIVEAVGDSMGETIPDGSTCIIRNYNGEQIKDGAIYFFSIGDDYFIKRLTKNINEIVIVSDNRNYHTVTLRGDEINKLRIYGEVIKNMRDF